MFRRLKRPLMFLAVFLLIVFGLAMLDPVFRQLVFGPKYGGLPLTAWQRFYWQWLIDDPKSARRKPTFLEGRQQAFFFDDPDPGDWKRLSGEDRRAILLTLAEDPKEVVRMHVAAHLGDVPPSPEVLAQLRRYTEDEGARVRRYAARSLGQVDPPAIEFVPHLTKLLRDSDMSVREAASQAITKIGSKAPEVVVPQLIPLMQSPDTQTRALALHVLGQMRSAAREAIPAVREALRDPHWLVRTQAARALGLLKAKEAVGQLSAALHDPDPGVRTSAAEALRSIGPEGHEAIPPPLPQFDP